MMSRNFSEASCIWKNRPSLDLLKVTNTEPFLDDEGNESTRSLGLIVARGTLLVLISPLDGSEQIPNPFNNFEE